jgi:hypothetical protein
MAKGRRVLDDVAYSDINDDLSSIGGNQFGLSSKLDTSLIYEMNYSNT